MTADDLLELLPPDVSAAVRLTGGRKAGVELLVRLGRRDRLVVDVVRLRPGRLAREGERGTVPPRLHPADPVREEVLELPGRLAASHIDLAVAAEALDLVVRDWLPAWDEDGEAGGTERRRRFAELARGDQGSKAEGSDP